MAEIDTSTGAGPNSASAPARSESDRLTTDGAAHHPDPSIRRAVVSSREGDAVATNHVNDRFTDGRPTESRGPSGDSLHPGSAADVERCGSTPFDGWYEDDAAPTAGAADTVDPDPSKTPETTRRGRLRKWDRPRPPHDWRWYIGNLGRALIAVGLLMFGFVAYQLWGTAIETAAAQNQLEDDFTQQLGTVDVPEAPADTPIATTSADEQLAPENANGDPSDPEPEPEPEPEPVPDATSNGEQPTAVPVDQQNIPALDGGEALARLEIPRIGVDDIVVAGVEVDDLKKGPGHFPDTPLPGQLGNSAIAGHRTTYGAPFFDVDQLEVGDPIRVTTLNGVFTYRVTGQQIVSPSDYDVVTTSDPTIANLTLTSCHPTYSARQRIVIFSELDTTESAQVGAPVLNYGRPEPAEPTTAIPGDADLPSSADDDPRTDAADPRTDAADPRTDDDLGTDESPGTGTDESPGTGADARIDDTADNAIDELGTEPVNDGIADAFSDGWFSDPSANPQVGLWGLAVAAIAIGAYLLSHRLRRDWVGLLVGIVPFTLALYFFFQNVNRLLPPNL